MPFFLATTPVLSELSKGNEKELGVRKRDCFQQCSFYAHSGDQMHVRVHVAGCAAAETKERLCVLNPARRPTLTEDRSEAIGAVV